MAINKGTLDVGPTFDVTDNGDNEGTAFVDPRSIDPDLGRPASREGEMLLIQTINTGNATLYISIETSEGIFEWKRAQPMTYARDSTTGQFWNPSANFVYSYAR